MALKTYNFKQVAVIVGGRQITGFAEGDAVTVERNEDSWTLQVGAEGESTRSKSNNRSGKVTLRLQQASESNAVLDGFRIADELADNGLVPVLVKDNSGNSLYSAEQAWVVKPPAAAHGNKSAEREWVLETDNLVILEAGN